MHTLPPCMLEFALGLTGAAKPKLSAWTALHPCDSVAAVPFAARRADRTGSARKYLDMRGVQGASTSLPRCLAQGAVQCKRVGPYISPIPYLAFDGNSVKQVTRNPSHDMGDGSGSTSFSNSPLVFEDFIPGLMFREGQRGGL